MERVKKPLGIKFRNRKKGNKLSHVKVLTNQKFAYCILAHLSSDTKDQLCFLIFLLKTYSFFVHENFRQRLLKIYYYLRAEAVSQMGYKLGLLLYTVSVRCTCTIILLHLHISLIASDK